MSSVARERHLNDRLQERVRRLLLPPAIQLTGRGD